MDQGRPYFEMDFSDENLTDKTFDAGIDEFICKAVSGRHWMYIASPGRCETSAVGARFCSDMPDGRWK